MFVNLYMGIGDIANGRNGDKKEERGFRNTFITYVDKLVQVLDKGITVVIIFYEVHNQYFAFGVYVHLLCCTETWCDISFDSTDSTGNCNGICVYCNSR